MEKEGAKYALRLNYGRSDLVTMGGDTSLRFEDGTMAPKRDEVKYWEGSLDNTCNRKKEIMKRIAATTAQWKRMDAFWLKSNCNTKKKILIYNAIVQSKLLFIA